MNNFFQIIRLDWKKRTDFPINFFHTKNQLQIFLQKNDNSSLKKCELQHFPNDKANNWQTWKWYERVGLRMFLKSNLLRNKPQDFHHHQIQCKCYTVTQSAYENTNFLSLISTKTNLIVKHLTSWKFKCSHSGNLLVEFLNCKTHWQNYQWFHVSVKKYRGLQIKSLENKTYKCFQVT